MNAVPRTLRSARIAVEPTPYLPSVLIAVVNNALADPRTCSDTLLILSDALLAYLQALRAGAVYPEPATQPGADWLEEMRVEQQRDVLLAEIRMERQRAILALADKLVALAPVFAGAPLPIPEHAAAAPLFERHRRAIDAIEDLSPEIWGRAEEALSDADVTCASLMQATHDMRASMAVDDAAITGSPPEQADRLRLRVRATSRLISLFNQIAAEL